MNDNKEKSNNNDPPKPRELSKIPQTIVPRSNRLSQERLILFIFIAVPFLGFILAIIWALYFGVSLIILGIFLVMFAITQLGIEAGYHRLFSHNAFSTSTAIRIFLAIAGSMAVQGPVVYWTSNHRRHHAYSDQPNDPHSPHLHDDGFWEILLGLWHAHIGWIFGAERTSPGRYGRDLLKDPVIMKIDKFYFTWVFLGLAIPSILGGLLTWSFMGVINGFLWGGLVRVFLNQQFVYSVNSLCHILGSRPFKTSDRSTNLLCLSLPTAGGSLHNTHHAFPETAVNSLYWWQIDPSGLFIRLLETMGLGWNVKTPSRELIAAKRVNS